MTAPPRSQPMSEPLSTEVDLILWVQLDPKEAADHILSLRAQLASARKALAEIEQDTIDYAAVRIARAALKEIAP